MHPVVAGKGRLGGYLLAWIPLAALVVFLLAHPGGLNWMEASRIAGPLCGVYAFVCLSGWYLAKALPLGRAALWNIALSASAASAVSSLLWVALGFGLAQISGTADRFQKQVSLMFAVGALLYLLAIAFHYVLLAAETSRQAQARELEARILAREAELKALKAQVNPHFLFNSLNSISALTTVDPARARDMCVLLSDFLRSTLGLGERASIPLSEEVALAGSYLAIEKVRFGSRLEFDAEVAPDCADIAVPPLLLQPLVENAVKHGLSGLIEGGRIHLEAQSTGRTLGIVVENPFDPEAPVRRHGMGLDNVRQRLEARFGGAARLDVSRGASHYRVEITMPLEPAHS